MEVDLEMFTYMYLNALNLDLFKPIELESWNFGINITVA